MRLDYSHIYNYAQHEYFFWKFIRLVCTFSYVVHTCVCIVYDEKLSILYINSYENRVLKTSRGCAWHKKPSKMYADNHLFKWEAWHAEILKWSQYHRRRTKKKVLKNIYQLQLNVSAFPHACIIPSFLKKKKYLSQPSCFFFNIFLLSNQHFVIVI